MVTRRSFLVTGIVGGTLLATAWWIKEGLHTEVAGSRGTAERDAHDILARLALVLLAGMLPPDETARRAAIAEVVATIDAALAGLPAETQREFAQLFALLRWSPTRLIVARVTQPWNEAEPAEVEAMLQRWRESRLSLFRSAYGGLHQLVLGAWYGMPRSWAAIGYPGPPELGAAS